MNNTGDLESFELHKEGISSSVPVGSNDVTNLTDEADLYLGNTKKDITFENTREYWKDRIQENLNLLYSKGPHLVEVYTDIVAKDPQLKIVKLTDEDVVRNAYFCNSSVKDGQLIPEIAFNFNNQETYIDSNLEYLLRQIAIQIGAKYEDIKDNKKLVTTFVLLHEFGHARDFIDNYLKPSENKGKKPIAEVLKNATTEKSKRRLRDLMTLPAPTHIDWSKEEDRKKYRRRLETFGIKADKHGNISRDQIKIVSSIAYREMSSESIADSFAIDYITKHRRKYFLSLGEQDDHSGRIKTGGEIMMEDKDIILSGIRDGNSITIKKIAQEGDSRVPIGYTETGFLDGQLALGESLRLVQDIDDLRFTQTSPLTMMSRRMLTDGRTLFIAKTLSGATYEVIRNQAVKPKQIQKTVEEINKALNLRGGSEVIIMKRNIINEGESAVVIGKTMQGRLGSSPKLGANILLHDEDGKSLGNTSPVIEVRRTWRTWLFKTFSDSIYEIIPTE
jgi:hypothetical protein